VQITEQQAGLEPFESNEVSLRDILDILYRRRRTIWIVIGLSMLAAVFLMLRPRKYTADGTIRVQPGTASMYRTSPLSMLSGESTDKIASETAIVQSRTLYLQVAKELNLVNNSAFWGKSSLKQHSIEDPKTREKLIRQMKKEIAVGHNPKDELINISCTTISPALSSKIVNTLINDYIGYLFQMRYGSTKRASGWLVGQLDDLKQQIEQDQANIIDLQKKLGVIGLNEQTADYLQTESLNSMTKAASEATIERIVAEAKLRYLEDSDPNLMEGEVNLLNQEPTPGQNSLLQNLRNAQAQAASNYARLLAQFGPNYPEVRQQKAQLEEIKTQVKTEQQRILNQARLSYNAARTNEKMDNEVLKRKTGQAFQSGGDMVRYVLLLHDYESHRTLYEGLIQRLREAGITSGLEAGEIDIVDLADLPVIPNPPGPLLILAGALFAGLFVGCFVALAADSLDTRVTSVDQVTRAIPLPLLTMLPHIERTKQKAGFPESGGGVPPTSQYAEALQALRTSILLTKPGAPPKVLLVTSAVPTEGKSTTARNLAMIFARHHSRVLLIDCDLRRGGQAAALGLKSSPGLSEALTRNTPIESIIQTIPEFDHLSVLPSGARPPDPAVLMASEQMARVIAESASQFDFILLDSAPVLGISDAINLGRLVDSAILIVREGFSNSKAIREAQRRLSAAHLPVTGFVLNDVDLRAHSYSYGYGYQQYRGYFNDSAENA
jgi:succinoglycan biosynthesis transport protein ExoP